MPMCPHLLSISIDKRFIGDWNLSVLCPIHSAGNLTVPAKI